MLLRFAGLAHERVAITGWCSCRGHRHSIRHKSPWHKPCRDRYPLL